MMQWKCKSCGSWVSMAYTTHNHIAVPRADDLQTMIRAREAGIDATDTVIDQERWTPAHETRKAPLNG